MNEKLIIGIIQAINESEIAMNMIRQIMRPIVVEVMIETGLVRPATEGTIDNDTGE